MLLQTLHEHRSGIGAMAARYGAPRLRVFGSVARGEEREDSDVALLVDLPPGYDLFTHRLPLAESKACHPEIPWCQIAGFRNVVVHEYLSEIGPEAVMKVLVEHPPALEAATRQMLDENTQC